MILHAAWPDICAALLGGAQGAPVRWRALFSGRSRPLLVSCDDAAAARRAVRFFCGSALLRCLGMLQLGLHRAIGLPRLPLLQHAGLVRPGLLGLPVDDLSIVAMQCGSPGPLQKITLFCTVGSSGPPLLVKLALRPSADVAVEREVQSLQRLAQMPHLAGFIPVLQAHGRLPSGRAFLTTDALDDARPVHDLAGPVRQVLTALGDANAPLLGWADCPSAQRLRQRWVACRDVLPRHEAGLIAAALAELDLQLASVALPQLLQHGDFAPWNIRQSGSHLCVFDWEYAQLSCNPLADFLHFHMIPRALGAHTPDAHHVHGVLLPQAVAFAREAWPSLACTPALVSGLMLEYLLDTVLFYTQSSCRFEPEHPVVRAYTALIEQRAQWSPLHDHG